MWKEKLPQIKIDTSNTKERKLMDFPGVNTPQYWHLLWKGVLKSQSSILKVWYNFDWTHTSFFFFKH